MPVRESDLEIAEAALDGEPEAISAIREIVLSPKIKATLVNRGAMNWEADEIVREILSDCFGLASSPGGEIKRLLDRYNGACPLEGFIHRVAMNRLIDRKRHQTVVNRSRNPGSAIEIQSATVGLSSEHTSDRIVELIVDALRRAFAEADQESLALLRLTHSYDISQRKLAKMWNCHESTISRRLNDLAEALRTRVLEILKMEDPWLAIEWRDIQELCQQSLDIFDY